MGEPGMGLLPARVIGRADRHGRTARCARLVVAATALVAVGVAWPAAAQAQSRAGTASGTLTLNGKAVPLKYAYAMIQPNTFDAAKNDTAVLLTEKPLPDGALDGLKDLWEATHPLLRSGKHEGMAFFKINSDGKPIYELIDHPAVKQGKYGQIQMSGFTHAGFVPKKMGPDRVEGTFVTSQPEDFLSYKYEIEVDFSAPLPTAKRPPTAPSAKTGKALPAAATSAPQRVGDAALQNIKVTSGRNNAAFGFNMPAVRLWLPRVPNSAYATEEFGTPKLIDARGRPVAHEVEHGIYDHDGWENEIRFATKGNPARMSGTIHVRYPTRIRAARKSDPKDALTEPATFVKLPPVVVEQWRDIDINADFEVRCSQPRPATRRNVLALSRPPSRSSARRMRRAT
jgi:hypothetical protein